MSTPSRILLPSVLFALAVAGCSQKSDETMDWDALSEASPQPADDKWSDEAEPEEEGENEERERTQDADPSSGTAVRHAPKKDSKPMDALGRSENQQSAGGKAKSGSGAVALDTLATNTPSPEPTTRQAPKAQYEVDGVADLESDDRDFSGAEITIAGERARSKSEEKSRRTASKPMAGPAGAVAAAPVTTTTTGASMPVAPPMEPTGGDYEDLPVADANTEVFADYGINDMTLVEKDAFSTFSVDVDTGAYTVSRRKLQEGYLPPTAAVRVEEFVNYFPYDYAAPSNGTNDGAPFAVHMEAAPSPWDSTHHVMRVGVKGMEIDQSNRAPMHLTFLVDTSGSMSSADKIGLLRESLSVLVSNLGEEDTVAIATYAGSTKVVLKPTSATNRHAILGAIDDLRTGGGTAMGSGMEMAYQMASETYLHGAENRVIVLSDGDANIGRTSHQDILRTVEQYAEEGITLTTVGFGMGNYKDVMMEQLANKGDGNYFYIDNLPEARKVFGTDIAGTLQVIAKDTKIQVEFNPDAVLAYRLIGYENRDIADKDFRNDRVDAGEIGSGHTVTALYDVVLADDAGSQELATVRLRAKKPGVDSAAREWATVFDGELLHGEFNDASKDLRLAFAAASFAELLRGSPYTAEISYADVANLARSASRGYDEDKELVGLITTAGRLSGEASSVAGR